MDNIQPPAGAPQGSADPNMQGGQPPPVDPNQTGQNQPDPNQAPPAGGGGDSLQMPPDVGGTGAPAAGWQPPTAPIEGSTDQGQVEDVLEGTENTSGFPAGQEAGQAGVPAPMGPEQAPPDQAYPPSTPQAQPDFSGGGGMSPGDQQMAGQPAMGQPQPGGGGSKGKLIFVILLIVIILGLGGLTVAYFMDLVSLPFLDNLLGRGQTTETTAPTDQTQQSLFPEDDQRKSDLKQIKSALESYFQTNQKYPIAKTAENSSRSTSAIYKALVPDLLQTMPLDPVTPKKYYGYKSADGVSFELTAVLDNKDDTEGVTRGSLLFYVLTNNSDVSGETQPGAATGTGTGT